MLTTANSYINDVISSEPNGMQIETDHKTNT